MYYDAGLDEERAKEMAEEHCASVVEARKKDS
jgi:hypothetical protein